MGSFDGVQRAQSIVPAGDPGNRAALDGNQMDWSYRARRVAPDGHVVYIVFNFAAQTKQAKLMWEKHGAPPPSDPIF
jgi:hypothetical protein